MTLEQGRAWLEMKAKPPMEFTDAERMALAQLAEKRSAEGYPVRHMWSDTAIGLRRLYKRGLVDVYPGAEGQPVVRLVDAAAGCQAARMRAAAFGARDAASLLNDWSYWVVTPVLSRDVPQMALVAALHWHYADRDRVDDHVEPDVDAQPRVVRVDIKPAHPAEHGINGGRGAVVAEHLSDGTIRARRVEAPEKKAAEDALVVTPHLRHRHERHRWDEPDHYEEPGYAAVVLALMEATAPHTYEAWSPVSVDLRTWTVTVGGTGGQEPSTVAFTSTVPIALKAALHTMEAPEFATVEEFIHWAEESLTAPALCGGTLSRRAGDTMGWYKPKRSGAKRHSVRFNPHTLDWTTQDAPSHDVAAHHREFAERYPEAGDGWGCAHTARAVRTVAPAEELWRTGRYSPAAAERLAAIRCITRAVQFLDHGLDLHDTAYLLPLGISGTQAATVHAAVVAADVSQSEAIDTLNGVGLEFVGLRVTVDNADVLVARLLDPTHDRDDDIFGAHLHEMLDAINRVGNTVTGTQH